MNKKKGMIIGGAVFGVLLVGILIAKAFGSNLFKTVSGIAEGQPVSFSSVNDLSSGKAYVWHHDGANIEDDLSGKGKRNVFFTCIKGNYNFKNQEMKEAINYPRTIWIEPDKDEQIPTVTSKDRLIYVSSTEVPDGIMFERFADYGYTIGVSNMQPDKGGHYYITFADTDSDDYKYFIDQKSDAAQLTELTAITKLYLDKVGKVRVDESNVSAGGTVMGLEKGKAYTCEFYTGTFYQDFNLTANVHTFSSIERFKSYDYEFMHSNFIVIDIPDYFKSGYYFVNGVGFFRYVSDVDAKNYNGQAYDAGVNWNDPIIIYDERGMVIYDPSDPFFEERVEEIEEKPVDDTDEEGVMEYAAA